MDVYIDSSVNPQQEIGVGVVAIYAEFGSLPIVVHYFDLKSVSSTVAEFQTFLLAYTPILQEQKNLPTTTLTIFTDCENLVKLLDGTRDIAKLENHPHFSLYSSVKDAYKNLGQPRVVWIKGHDTKENLQHSTHKQRFSSVDKLARHLLRKSKKLKNKQSFRTACACNRPDEI